MQVLRSARLCLMALLVCLIPASSYAGVFISVAIAPPVLPVYDQPPCPEAGWMWTPGYWAYGPDGYYWVPGTWVPAPYVGALWTPGYWGWGNGLYVWHGGYWGSHVGYYGGVNYGFGYMGVGFAGGLWMGNAFRYNTAIMHVNTAVIHNTYVDRTVVQHDTIVNDRHVAFSGGPGGINHAPTADENRFSHEQHAAPTSFQAQHQTAARGNANAYASHNGGHPATTAVARPMTGTHAAIGSQSSGSGAGRITHSDQSHVSSTPQQHNNAQPNGGRPGGGAQPRYNAQPQSRPQNEPRPQSQMRPVSPRIEPQPRPPSQPHGGAPQGGQPHGGGEPHGGGGGHEHGH
jgi:hypothetical protein